MRNWINLILASGAIATNVWSQATSVGSFRADRGFMSYGTYSLSDTESIDSAKGGITFQLPMATLPAGRAGHKHGVGLSYNSNFYENRTELGSSYVNRCSPPNTSSDCPAQVNILTEAFGASWRYTFNYRLNSEIRPGLNQYCSMSVGEYSFYLRRRTLILPDGSEHVLRLQGSTDYFGDGYYKHLETGASVCSNTSTPNLSYRVAQTRRMVRWIEFVTGMEIV